jgi:galactokinase
MTGAGFGGCALALVERDAVAAFIEAVSRAYSSETGLTPALYACTPSAGASISPPPA